MEKQKKTTAQRVAFIRRPWFEWVVWVVWLLLEIFFLQNAIASRQEIEPRAAILFWVMFGILLLGGVTTFVIRRVNKIIQLPDEDD